MLVLISAVKWIQFKQLIIRPEIREESSLQAEVTEADKGTKELGRQAGRLGQNKIRWSGIQNQRPTHESDRGKAKIGRKN